MPELPEVETTRAGISPYMIGESFINVKVHNARLRWPVNADIEARLSHATINDVRRRAKYLIFDMSDGDVICHLGMSGSLRLCSATEPRRKHDHIECVLSNQYILRFHDPRRFGCFLWVPNAHENSLITRLGPEPLTDDFNGAYLFQQTRHRKQAIKKVIMDHTVVVGVGNIYASEALFAAGINPLREAGRVSKKRYEKLANDIKKILLQAISVGGTTLKDFVNPHNEPGYFEQQLKVYQREGQLCSCGRAKIKRVIIAQRASFYCGACQL